MTRSSDERFHCSLSCALRLAHQFLARVDHVGFCALPTIEVFLTFLFRDLKLVTELFQLRFRGANIAELIFRLEIDILFVLIPFHEREYTTGGIS